MSSAGKHMPIKYTRISIYNLMFKVCFSNELLFLEKVMYILFFDTKFSTLYKVYPDVIRVIIQ